MSSLTAARVAHPLPDEPPQWNARQVFVTLLVLAFTAQVVRVLPPRPRDGLSAWEAMWLPVAVNLVPHFPAAFLLLRAERQPRRGTLRVVGRHLGMFIVYSVSSVLLALVARAFAQSPETTWRTMRGADYWISALVIAPYWYLLFATIAFCAVAYERTVASARERTRLIEAQRASETLRLATELRMLRTYVQPHFLFNTLNAIASLIDVAPDKARQAIVTTSELLRATLGASGEDDIVTLGEELQVAAKYLAVEELRMGERLRVTFDVAPEARHASIPRFTVQAIVENAIRHGVFPQAHGGTITVKATLAGPDVIIEVSDDGVGSAVDPSVAPGLGLRSVRERLHAMFGAAAQLTWESAPGQGFRVRLRIPADRDLPGHP